jgi:hypothetical protein
MNALIFMLECDHLAYSVGFYQQSAHSVRRMSQIDVSFLILLHPDFMGS